MRGSTTTARGRVWLFFWSISPNWKTIGRRGGSSIRFEEVLLLVTCATIASCDDFEDIVEWGEHHLDFLRQFSDFHHGVPCARWLRDLVNRVDPALFAGCFKNWIAALWPDRHDLIAIDGKTSRRTHDHRKGLKALHTLSAYATTARLTLAQLSVPEKTNEITAIPVLLDQLAENKQLEGALVTIDAMGCQVEIADKIVAHKADYLLALRGNQPTLEADVLDYFSTAPAAEIVATTTDRDLNPVAVLGVVRTQQTHQPGALADTGIAGEHRSQAAQRELNPLDVLYGGRQSRREGPVCVQAVSAMRWTQDGGNGSPARACSTSARVASMFLRSRSACRQTSSDRFDFARRFPALTVATQKYKARSGAFHFSQNASICSGSRV